MEPPMPSSNSARASSVVKYLTLVLFPATGSGALGVGGYSGSGANSSEASPPPLGVFRTPPLAGVSDLPDGAPLAIGVCKTPPPPTGEGAPCPNTEPPPFAGGVPLPQLSGEGGVLAPPPGGEEPGSSFGFMSTTSPVGVVGIGGALPDFLGGICFSCSRFIP